MKKARPDRKKIKSILENKSYTKLDEFLEPQVWGQLGHQEKEDLSLALIEWGASLLKEGNSRAVEILEYPEKVDPYSLKVLMELGRCWYEYSKKNFNPKGLCNAKRAFEKVVEHYPASFDAWAHLGMTSLYLGITHQSSEDYRQALDFFAKAETLSPDSTQKRASLYWHWGRCWTLLGKVSGEAVEFRQAIQTFEKVPPEESPSHLFWNDYANAVVELGCLVGQAEQFEHAMTLYENCVEIEPDCFEAWLNAACTAQRLYHLTYSRDYVVKAHECFAKASKLVPNNLNLWAKWGELFLVVGKMKRSVKWIKESLAKFSKADDCEKDHPLVLNRWAEALMILGGSKKSLKLLRLAEERVLRSLSIAPENPEGWYVYGSCLCEMGNYFGHVEHFHEAIEKFQYGLTLSKNHPLLWYGLAMAYYFLAESEDSLSHLENSLACFSKVGELGSGMTQLWSDWGIALMKMGEMVHEKEFIELAIEKFEKNPNVQRGVDPESLYHYGCAFDILGDFYEDETYYERAAQILSYVLTLDPSYSHARYNLAVALSHLGEATGEKECFFKANDYFQSIVEKDSEDEMAWNEWGMSLLNLANLHDEEGEDLFEYYCVEAESKFRHAAALGNIQSYYPLACVYSLMGRYEAAMHFIERADRFEALPPIKVMMCDEWLEGVRTTGRFRRFVDHLAKQYEESAEE